MATQDQGGGNEQDVTPHLQRLAALVGHICQTDPQSRTAIRAVGAWLIDAAETAERATGAPSPPDGAETPETTPEVTPQPIRELVLNLSGASLPVRVPEGGVGPVSENEPPAHDPAASDVSSPTRSTSRPSLGTITRRTHLKAESCRWAAARRRRLAEDADFKTAIAPTDKELLDRARAMEDCYLWMLDPYGPTLPEDRELGEIEAAYENLAAATELMQSLLRAEEDEPELEPPMEAAVAVLAEAQSALRAVLLELGMTRREADQADAFDWLRLYTFENNIFVARYMKRDDVANPAAWQDLQSRINAIESSFESSRQKRRQRRMQFNRARYHASRLDRDDPAEALDDWGTLLQCVDDLVAEGVNPSDVDLRDLLLPYIDRMPDSIEPGDNARLVLAAIDRYLAGRERQEPAREPDQRTPEVERATALLRGQRVVLIGGVERPHARRALEQEFGLSELCWISTSPHMSISAFEPEVARPETAVVILAIRWSSHSFEGVREMCRTYGKAFIRLPGGYGVNQVARQVLTQVSEQLVAH